MTCARACLLQHTDSYKFNNSNIYNDDDDTYFKITNTEMSMDMFLNLLLMVIFLMCQTLRL